MKKEYNENDIIGISWQEAVKLRPTLYFSDCYDEKSLDSLPLEVACHAIDEIIDGNCSSLKFIIFDDSFSLEYDAGMLRAEDIMTKMFICRNGKKHLSVGERFCKLGIATINAITEYSELTTIVNAEKHIIQFKLGETEKHEVIPENEVKEFTQIIMKPSTEVFKELTFTYEGVEKKVEELQQEFE